MFFSVYTLSIFTGKLSKRENLDNIDELSTYIAKDNGAYILIEASNGANIIETWDGEKYVEVVKFNKKGAV